MNGDAATLADLLKAVYSLGIAVLAILGGGLGVVAYHTPAIVKGWLERNKLIRLDLAGGLAARSVEERDRGVSGKLTSAAKQDAAKEILKSIAPNALKGVDDVHLTDVVKAGVAKMRASVPTGDALAVVRLSSPPSADALHGQVPLPKPAPMPGGNP